MLEDSSPLKSADVITLPTDEALEKYKEYTSSVQRSRTAMDRLMIQSYRALSKGHGIINVPAAIKKAGVHANYKPRLAIMRADCEAVFFHRDGSAGYYSNNSRYYLRSINKTAQKKRLQFAMPGNTFQEPISGQYPRDYYSTHTAPVPPIPPIHRPADAFSKYCILWEVDKWEAIAPPADPMLLRPLGQTGLYVVVAHWDLTPLEQMVMGGLLGQ